MKKRLSLNDILVPVILAVSGWICVKTHDNSVDLAAMKVTVTTLVSEHNTTQEAQASQKRQIWSLEIDRDNLRANVSWLDKKYDELKTELNKKTGKL